MLTGLNPFFIRSSIHQEEALKKNGPPTTRLNPFFIRSSIHLEPPFPGGSRHQSVSIPSSSGQVFIRLIPPPPNLPFPKVSIPSSSGQVFIRCVMGTFMRALFPSQSLLHQVKYSSPRKTGRSPLVALSASQSLLHQVKYSSSVHARTRRLMRLMSQSLLHQVKYSSPEDRDLVREHLVVSIPSSSGQVFIREESEAASPVDEKESQSLLHQVKYSSGLCY